MRYLTLRRFALLVSIVMSMLIGYSIGRVLPDARVITAFHQLYYATQFSTGWLGVPTQKSPLDMWVYQEILTETRPDVLLEMGTFKGGSAYYFASMFDLIGHGRVITVDIEKEPNLPVHPRVTYLLGSSTSPEIVGQIRSALKPGEKVMVVLDSDHHAAHVRRELEIYSQMVTNGQYLVVEDTDINGHPVLAKWGPGPAEATTDFLTSNHDFTRDLSREKFLITFFPGGWLKRVR